MDPVHRAELVAGRGLVDNANQGGKRQVTLIERETWTRVTRELGVEVPPTARRANLMVSGVPLMESRGRTIRIAGCRVHILGETRPCGRMDEAHPGLRAALERDWRGGAYGEVLDDGEIGVGDEVRWADEP